MSRQYHKDIIFTNVPLQSSFRYKDVFQIYPVEMDRMPKSVYQQHHPVILEYCTTNEDKIEVISEYENLRKPFSNTATKLTKQDKILLLLSLFTNHLFFRYRDLTGFWGMAILHDYPKDEASNWPTKWIIPGFDWPEMAGKFSITDFSQPQVPEVTFISHLSYYQNNPNIDLNNQLEITFPDSIYYGLDAYFSISDEKKMVLDDAISFSVSAMEMLWHKKTLAIVSAFTSVETMVNLEYRNVVPEKCSSCNQLKYGVTKKFTDYLLKYLGDTKDNKKKFKTYYSQRSKIVHQGRRLISENIYSEMSKEERDKENVVALEIIQMSKLAIIHWLLNI